MIPSITHPAGELVIRKLNEAAANLGSFAAQLDGQARTLLIERDSQTGLDGFRTAFGDEASDVLESIRGFRQLYTALTGHDVPPLQGQAELALPEVAPNYPTTDATPPPAVDGAAPAAAPSAPAETSPVLSEDTVSEPSDAAPPAAPTDEGAAEEKPKRRK
jgi:hypothetical protein